MYPHLNYSLVLPAVFSLSGRGRGAYPQQKHTTWARRGQIFIAQSKANCLSWCAPVIPPLDQRRYEQHHVPWTWNFNQQQQKVLWVWST